MFVGGKGQKSWLWIYFLKPVSPFPFLKSRQQGESESIMSWREICSSQHMLFFPPPSMCDCFKIWAINKFSVLPIFPDKYLIASLEIFEFLGPIDWEQGTLNLWGSKEFFGRRILFRFILSLKDKSFMKCLLEILLSSQTLFIKTNESTFYWKSFFYIHYKLVEWASRRASLTHDGRNM